MTYRDYRIGFPGTDLISPTQFEYYPELKYRMPQALDHALYRLEEVQGEINDMELSEEVRRIARKRRHILNGWISYYREQLQRDCFRQHRQPRNYTCTATRSTDTDVRVC